MESLLSADQISRRIYLFRGHKVMLDRDLAELYGVPTKVLNQAVRRHRRRFQPDFVFQLNDAELENWKSQIVTSNFSVKMGLRKRPFAFTEHGVLMLSSVLNSERAIQVNIAVMRAFVKLRETLALNKDLADKFNELECRVSSHDSQIRSIFDAIRELMEPPQPDDPPRRIGFQP